jgi:hypothetical protein
MILAVVVCAAIAFFIAAAVAATLDGLDAELYDF